MSVAGEPSTVRVPGVLFVHEDPLAADATTIREHVGAFLAHSRFDWYPINVTFGLPPGLRRYEFAAVVYHYSLRPTYHWLTPDVRDYLAGCAAHRVAIFQDEVWYFRERDRFLAELRIDCLYSRHKPHHVRDVYGSRVKDYAHYMAGCVADEMVARANRLARPYADRPTDVGYRGRRLGYYFGRGGQEKGEIAERFAELTTGRGLRLDVASRESDRLYGEHWDRFLADCKAVLGVEGGVSVIDRTGRFRELYDRLVAQNPKLTFAEYRAAAGPDFEALEDRIDYRSVTPRHFESAAFRNLQILFEGKYDGVLEPWTHYVPLRKDFSNLDEVLAVLGDPVRATAITDRAYADLIASGRYTYQGFVRSFDDRLAAASPVGPADPRLDRDLRAYLVDWDRFQSRARDFAVLTADRNKRGEADKGVATASELFNAYRRRVEARAPGEHAGVRAWYRRVADRGFWAQVERWLKAPVPARPEFDPTLGRRSMWERLVAGPAAAWRMMRLYAARAGRKARTNWVRSASV